MSWIAEAHERAAEGHLKECCERIVKALGRMIPFYRVFSSSPRLLGAHLEFSGALGTYRVAEGLGVEPREVARDFARRVLGAGADAWDEAGEYPLAAFREAAALGLAGLFVPVADGGQGQDGLTGGLILEQLARGCFGHNVRPRRPQQLRGELLGGFALTEPDAGTDAAAITTTATPERGGYRLDDVKAWVTNDGTADLYNVMARTAPRAAGGSSADGISSLVVERDRPGVSFGPRDRVTGARAPHLRAAARRRVGARRSPARPRGRRVAGGARDHRSRARPGRRHRDRAGPGRDR